MSLLHDPHKWPCRPSRTTWERRPDTLSNTRSHFQASATCKHRRVHTWIEGTARYFREAGLVWWAFRRAGGRGLAEAVDESAGPSHALSGHHELLPEGLAERPGRIDAELCRHSPLVCARVEHGAQAPRDDDEVAIGLHARGHRPQHVRLVEHVDVVGRHAVGPPAVVNSQH